MDTEDNKKELTEEKKSRKISEETLHIITNLVITTVSIASLMASIITGSKAKRKS